MASAQDVGATFLRLHNVPLVVLAVGAKSVAVSGRTSCVLTGTRGAGASCRIPALDVWAHCQAHNAKHGLKMGTRKIALGTFVDNLESVGRSMKLALRVQQTV